VVCTSFRTCMPTLGSTRSLQRTQAVNADRGVAGFYGPSLEASIPRRCNFATLQPADIPLI
jgi:hypothetical protein